MTIKVAKDGYAGVYTRGGGVMLIDGVLHEGVHPFSGGGACCGSPSAPTTALSSTLTREESPSPPPRRRARAVGEPGEVRALLARVEAAGGPDKVLGIDILSTLCPNKYRRGVMNGGENDGEVYLIKFKRRTKWRDAGWYGVEDKDPTHSLDAAVALVERVLPGWAWSCGSCVVSHDGWVKPDVEGPDKHLSDVFDEGFFGDAKGGNVPLSLVEATLRGLIAKMEVARAG